MKKKLTGRSPNIGPTSMLVSEKEESEKKHRHLAAYNRADSPMKNKEKWTENINTVLESISDMVMAFDHNWNILYLNKKAAAGSGISRNELIGKNIWDVQPDYKHTDLYDNLMRAMKTKKFCQFDFYSPFVRRWYHYRSYPTAHGIVLYQNDITEKKELEVQKDSFIAHASHELKTPLTSLKLYIGALGHQLKRHSDAHIHEYLQGMEERIDKLTQLINSILDASRLEQGKEEFHKTDFDIDELVHETARTIEKIARNHLFHLDLRAKKKVHADRPRLERTLTNLINNAVAYSPKGSSVKIQTRAQKGFITISVKDSGIGISAQDQDRIFGRFFQSNDERRRKLSSGLGLGLSITKNIIEGHGGTIRVQSSPGKGSTFTIQLPINKK